MTIIDKGTWFMNCFTGKSHIGNNNINENFSKVFEYI